LISLQLGQAKKELLAQQNLSQAKEAFQYEQWDKARQLLAMVPSASVYANEAKEYTDKIGRQEQISQALGSAKAFYSQGQLIPALGEIDKGLKISADSPTLLDLQNRIRTMVPLAGPLKKAQSLGQDSSIDELLAARKSSAEVLQTENDPLNSMVKSAKDVDAHVLQWLQTISQTDTDNAQGLLKSGNPTGALSLFTQAVKANPKNQTAVEQATRLQKEIVGQCMELYGMAMRYKELGLTDKVRENLKRVLELDLPDDRWYKLATEELARLK
jgi:tetratricopeptide (TPR) repeat protein